MSFLNAILLSGGAALLLPLILYLLNLRRITPQPWAAMHLLQAALAKRRRNLRIEQWLLLLIRLLIPLLLALCLARPVMTAMRVFGGGKSSLLVLLDDSYSMQAGDAASSPSQRAKQELSRILQSLPKGSEVQVMRGSAPDQTLLNAPTAALDIAAQALQSHPSTHGPLRLQDALSAAASWIEKSPPGNRELLVVSDFSKRDWGNAAQGAGLPALQSLSKMPQGPQLTFYDLRPPQAENLAVVAAETSAQIAAVGQPIGLRVRVVNHGQRAWQDLPISFEVDGKRLRTSRLSLAAQGEAVLTFTHKFDAIGKHALSARIEGDSFALDNARHGIVEVRKPLEVLLLEDEKPRGSLEAAGDFLSLALSPHQSAGSDLKDLMQVTRNENRLRQDDLKGREVVILADVERLRSNLNLLEKFVTEGGGLLVFVGPKADLTWYQRDFYNRGKGLFPSPVLGLRRAANGLQPARIAKGLLSHPAMLYFNDTRAGRLQDAEFQSWWELGPAEGTRTLLSLDSGTPLIVERQVGRGRVIAVASSAGTAWNNAALQPFFVPLTQRLVSHLSSSSMVRDNLTVGESPRFELTSEEAALTHQLVLPSGQRVDLGIESENQRRLLVIPTLQEPGVMQWNCGNELRLLACNLDPQEADFTPLATADLEALAKRHSARVVNSPESWQQLDRGRRHGSELWKPLLAILLLLLFAEVLLQQRITRG